jgi:hypothetical protein
VRGPWPDPSLDSSTIEALSLVGYSGTMARPQFIGDQLKAPWDGSQLARCKRRRCRYRGGIRESHERAPATPHAYDVVSWHRCHSATAIFRWGSIGAG